MFFHEKAFSSITEGASRTYSNKRSRENECSYSVPATVSRVYTWGKFIYYEHRSREKLF